MRDDKLRDYWENKRWHLTANTSAVLYKADADHAPGGYKGVIEFGAPGPEQIQVVSSHYANAGDAIEWLLDTVAENFRIVQILGGSI